MAHTKLYFSQQLFETAATSDAQQEEYDLFTDLADELDVALNRLGSKTKKLPQSTQALCARLDATPRVKMLCGSRKKELVLNQKNHIGEIKSLL
jgi:hypothetical protein